MISDLPEKITHTTSYIIGSGTATGAYMNLSDLGIVVGIVFTVLTYLTFLTFAIRRDRRERREG